MRDAALCLGESMSISHPSKVAPQPPARAARPRALARKRYADKPRGFAAIAHDRVIAIAAMGGIALAARTDMRALGRRGAQARWARARKEAQA